VKVEGGKVVVDTSVVLDQEENPAGWSAAGVKVA
jgi:hypothetical protein